LLDRAALHFTDARSPAYAGGRLKPLPRSPLRTQPTVPVVGFLGATTMWTNASYVDV
jgi:hypothetical protein